MWAICLRAGWDVFSLRYSVEEPLATVMTDAAAAQIQAVARLLWALKRAEHSLSAAWLLLNTTQRTLTRLTTKAKRAHLSCTGAPSLHAVLVQIARPQFYATTQREGQA